MVNSKSRDARCVLYTPGHSIHWIQARLTWKNPKHHAAVTITEIDEVGFVVETSDGPVRFLNHDTVSLQRYVDQVGREGSLVGYGVLQLPTTAEGAIPMICVIRDEGEPLDRCIQSDDLPALPSGATPTQIAEHLLEAVNRQGGATVFLR